MDKFLIILAAVVVILLLVAIFGGRRFNLRKILYFFIEEVDETDGGAPRRSRNTGNARAPRRAENSSGGNRRNPNQIHNEMAILMQKIDERRRVVDSSGHSTLYDEYFELVFQTRKGETLHLTASRAAFKEIPFNQQGALTYKRGAFVKFKYIGGLISDEDTPAQR